jgi:hypothetical protein
LCITARPTRNRKSDAVFHVDVAVNQAVLLLQTKTPVPTCSMLASPLISPGAPATRTSNGRPQKRGINSTLHPQQVSIHSTRTTSPHLRSKCQRQKPAFFQFQPSEKTKRSSRRFPTRPHVQTRSRGSSSAVTASHGSGLDAGGGRRGGAGVVGVQRAGPPRLAPPRHHPEVPRAGRPRAGLQVLLREPGRDQAPPRRGRRRHAGRRRPRLHPHGAAAPPQVDRALRYVVGARTLSWQDCCVSYLLLTRLCAWLQGGRSCTGPARGRTCAWRT